MCIESEAQMEQNLIETLVSNQYEKVNVKDEKSLLSNLKIQLERHNNITIDNNKSNIISTNPSPAIEDINKKPPTIPNI